MPIPGLHLPPTSMADDPASLARHFGGADDLLPLWIAEPYVDLAPEVTAVLQQRAAVGWFGYEKRPPDTMSTFWRWMSMRHHWDGEGLQASVSPSIGTSIGALLAQHTAAGDGVMIQPPVFTDFKPLIRAAGRSAVRNSLVLEADGYRMDLDGLADLAAQPTTTAMILCNPHNPVGRVWTAHELRGVAEICARHQVLVITDEIHADLILPPHAFTPFATAAAGTGVSWAALHGPIKTFGLAGVSDTLLITDDPRITEPYREMSSRLHLTRNNVFGIAATNAAYGSDGSWVDLLMETVGSNVRLIEAGLPDGLELIPPQGTYLAWLDLRALDMDVRELAPWLASAARLALSPGHWFGREGAGFARMSIAAPTPTVEEALSRLAGAVKHHRG